VMASATYTDLDAQRSVTLVIPHRTFDIRHCPSRLG
jgi:hypothetical protein